MDGWHRPGMSLVIRIPVKENTWGSGIFTFLNLIIDLNQEKNFYQLVKFILLHAHRVTIFTS